MTGMMRQARWRKLIRPESKNDVGGVMRQNKERDARGGKKKRGEGEGTISGGTRRDDLALNHRRS